MALYHLWSRYSPPDPDGQHRHALAESSWSRERWTALPIEDDKLPRLFKEKDRRFPHIRDLFDAGCHGRQPEDIIVFTNADIGVRLGLSIDIAGMMQDNDAGYGNRKDFGRLAALPSNQDIDGAPEYAGTDLFFFRVSWWTTHRTAYPDMILGREAWDPCMRVLMELTNANKPLSRQGLCWHERHGGVDYWENAENRYRLLGQRHNLALARGFLASNGYNPMQFGVR